MAPYLTAALVFLSPHSEFCRLEMVSLGLAANRYPLAHEDRYPDPRNRAPRHLA